MLFKLFGASLNGWGFVVELGLQANTAIIQGVD